MIATRLTIHGRVQGVFFRDWTIETARALGVAGWVRNEADGTVAAHLEGEPEAVQRMIAALHKGPSRAQVDRIEESEAEAEGLTSFQRR